MGRVILSAEDRFWPKVHKTDTCWLWTACIFRNGYGNFWDGLKNVKAHRFAYEILVGPIPDGFELDHVRARGCTNRHCVNPAHLEPVSKQENIRRGDAGKHWAAKTQCPQGHPYDKENTIFSTRGRKCRECGRTESRERQRAKARTKKEMR